MTVITGTQVISKPAEAVFDVLADLGGFAKWNPTIRSSRRLNDQPLGNGATFEWDLRGFGMVVQELQEYEPNVQLRIVPHIKPFQGGHRFRLTANGDQTRIDHELEMTPKGIFRLFAPAMAMIGRRNLRDTSNALEAHFDGTD